MAKPAFSTSPTLLQVDDVDATVRCLHEVFGLEIVGLSRAGEEGKGSCGMLENPSGSVRVVVVPRSADVLGGTETGGCATLTLATDSVRRASAAAVRAGARLVRSHRINLPAEERSPCRGTLVGGDGETQASVETGATTTSPNPLGSGGRDSEATGMAVLEGPLPRVNGEENGDKGGNSRNDNSAGLAVRVLLVDERLLTCRRRSHSAAEASAAAAAANAVASVETGLFGVAEDEPSAEAGTSSPTGEQEAGASSPAAVATTAPGEVSTPPPLLEGFVSLVRQSALRRKDASHPAGTEHVSAPGTYSAPELRGAQTPSATTNGGKAVEAGTDSWSGGDATCNGHGAAANGGGESGSSAGGGAVPWEASAVSVVSWFSEKELLREREGGGDGGGDEGTSEDDDEGQSGSPHGAGEAVAEARATTGALPGSSVAASPPARAPTAGDAREVDVGSSRQATKVAAAAQAATNGDFESARSKGGNDSLRSVEGARVSEDSTRARSGQELQTTVATEADREQEQEQERPEERHEENGRVLEENGGADATGQAEHETAFQAEQQAGGLSRAKPRLRQRPFRQLEAFMLGNDAGPLKASPNSIRPIPIDNQHFKGSALLMIKREPMDKSYAHMFEGKNRMFEVQVQGKFKKPPEGELYISLEITDMMKLGLLTRGLCKLLLSFGKKLNRRLHYSFGDKDNKELPHISFPLVTSVDSLVCTPDGGEVPVLGRPFEEDKQSKASRKSGVEDNAKGIGKFQTGFTYSFSFHSMYIDMAQWSTCKIPVMRDVDLHTFWGNSALRIAAYVIKPSSSAFSVATASHLQSELEYVFCVQVRHLPQSELGDGSDEEDWDEEGEPEGEGEEGGTQEAVTASATAAKATAQATPETAAQYEDEEEEGEEEGEEDGDGFIMDGEGGTAEIGDEIALPLLTDRSPSPRGRQKSASRWASNDDASDGEMEKRRERRRRRTRAQSDGTGLGEARGRPAAAASPVGDGGNGAGVDSSVESDEDDDDYAEEEEEEEEEEESRGNIDEGGGGGSSEQSPGTNATAAVAATPIEADCDHDTAGPAPGLRAEASQPAASQSPPSSFANPVRATTEAIFDGGMGVSAASASSGGGSRTGVRMGSTWDGATRGGGTGDPTAENGSRPRRGQEIMDDAEEGMVRCPAYVDLYARSPKLQGTWTVFCVVKRGASGGMFALRSSKNVSILPANVVQAKMQHSPRLSRKERKRRKVDTVLQVLTAPTHAHANRQYQVIVRAVLGMESSADRAYRSYNPAPTTTTTVAASSTAASTGASEGGGGGGGGGGGDNALGRSSGVKEWNANAKEAADFSAGISVEDATRSPSASTSASAGADAFPTERSPPYSPTPSSNKSGGSGNFSDGFTASANAVGKRRGSGTARRRSWVARSASSPIREGMVLRVLSEHHLSQQVAVLLPSSLTFSRPRKQCLRLSTRDIIHVELAGGSFEEGSRSKAPSPSSQLIPGMYLVEIHTIGRVHYMLVEGLAEAREWAASIHGARLAAAAHAADGSGSGGRSSPSSSSPSSPLPQISGNNSGSNDDLGCISDPFSQYLTKKSSWKASNFWVLNCRRALDLNNCATVGPASGGDGGSGGTVDAGWGGGCWMDQGGLGGEVCEFVMGLLNQALELNEDSKPEQLITFLDDICRLRWMPLEGLSHNEQLSVFLNLYHVMLLHAFFILGPPGSPLRVASYFTTLCYEVGGDVLSLADLEHGVLRAKTSQPKQFLSKLIIPTTEYPFSLRQPEPRVSFALNCGSASGVPGICIYRPDVVQEQLEDASAYYVQNTTEVLEGKRTVILPRIVYWYSADFSHGDNAEEPSGASGPLPSSSSSLSCLLHAKRYLVGDKRRQVDSLLSDGGNVTVKFGSWNWKCRPVNLVAESELEALRSGRPSPP